MLKGGWPYAAPVSNQAFIPMILRLIWFGNYKISVASSEVGYYWSMCFPYTIGEHALFLKS